MQKNPRRMKANKVYENVQGVADSGQPLELLRDVDFWKSKMRSKISNSQLSERAYVLMRSQGSLEYSAEIEIILRRSGLYKNQDISAHLDWARRIYYNLQFK